MSQKLFSKGRNLIKGGERVIQTLANLMKKRRSSYSFDPPQVDKDGLMDKEVVVRQLIKESHIEGDFYFLLVISTLITTLGLLMNNTAVVIGGMLIAPLLYPVLALGLGIVTDNKESLGRSLKGIIKSTLFVLNLSFLTAFIVGVKEPVNLEILQRAKPSLPFIYIAVLSGVGATFAWIKPRLTATLPGIAVAVALLPPLCVTGIGLAILNKTIVTGSFQLFFINLLGIAASSAVVFSLFGFHTMQRVEKKEIMKEEKEDKKG